MNEAARKSLQEYAAMPFGVPTGSTQTTQNTPAWKSELDAIQKKYKVQSITPPPPSQGNGILGGLGDIWNATGGAVAGQIGAGAQNIVGGIGDVGNALNPFSGQDLGQRVAGIAGAPLKALGGVAQIATSPSAPAISAGTSALKGATQQVGGGLGRAGGGLGKIAQNILPALGNTFSGQVGSDRFGTEVLKGATDLLGGGMQAAFSPVSGTIGSLPKSIQTPISAVGNALDSIQNKAWESVGVDVNSDEGRMLKENMNNFLTLLGATPAAKGLAGRVAAPLKAPLAKAGAQAAKTLDSAIDQVMKGAGVVGKTIGRGAKTVGKVGLEGASQSMWNIPGRDMRRAMEIGDDVLKVMDDVDGYSNNVLGKLSQHMNKLEDSADASMLLRSEIKNSKTPVPIKSADISEALAKHGLEFNNGKASFTGGDARNSTLTASDVAKLNRDVMPLLREGTMTPAQFLTVRNKIGKLGKFGVEMNKRLEEATQSIYNKLNDTARPYIPGLKEIDDQLTKDIGAIQEMKSNFMRWDDATKTYKIKPSVNTDNLSNLLSARNTDKLKLLEQIEPGITKQLEALALVKKAERASEVMTGATGKRLVSSVALGLGTGNPLMGIASMIVQDPMRAMKLFAKMKPLLKQTKRKPTSSKANAGQKFSTADAAGKASGVFTQAKKYSGGLGQNQQNP